MWVIVLCICLVLAAKLTFDRVQLSRYLVWLAVLAVYFVTHIVFIDAPGLPRMVVLCCSLMAGMKWVVYSEWRRNGGAILSWRAWLCFAFVWFGMDPMPWCGKRRLLRWFPDLVWGAGCAALGASLVVLMAKWGVDQLVLLFIAMSMAFHFGVLRLLTAFWKWRGVPVRTLFRNPLKMHGFTDFWGKRWNLAYSQMMARAVKRPLEKWLGPRRATFGVFGLSGLLHELAITVPVEAGYGMPTLFFLIQGIFTYCEKSGGRMMAAVCGLSLIVGLPILFPPRFVEVVIMPARDFMNFLTTI